MPPVYKSMIAGERTKAGTEEVLAAYDLSPIAVMETSGEA